MVQLVRGMAEFALEIEGNEPLDGRAAAAHLVVCYVLCVVTTHTTHNTVVCCVNFVGFSSADCRVDPSKLTKFSPQQKLGNNGPPSAPSTREPSSN